MCLIPITLKRSVQTMQGSNTNRVPCGKCPECLKRRYMSWAFRLIKESEKSTSAIFLTLTYAKEPISANGLPTLNKGDYQDFTKRLRKTLPNSNLKYYACGEYGSETSRPHYHSILFNLPQDWVEDPQKITDIWGHGHIHIAPCNIATIKYVTKYVMKGKFDSLLNDPRFPAFALMSKGLGNNYLTPEMVHYHKENLKSSVTLSGGVQQAMPRYYREKIFTIKERVLINIKSEFQRKINFKKDFNNNEHQKAIWTKDQFRKAKKIARLDRQKL